MQLDCENPNDICGENAQMEAGGNNRVSNRNRMNGTCIDRADFRHITNSRNYLNALIQEHVRTNYQRPTFADNCIRHIRDLGLGLEIENILIGIFRACLIEASNEDDVAPLPRNEMRFMTGRSAAYRQRVCVVAGLRAAASFSLCEGILSTCYSERWALERADCQRMTKRFVARIKRMIVAAYGDAGEARAHEMSQQRRRTQMHRDNELSAQVCLLRQILETTDLDNNTIRSLMRQVSGWIRQLGEPGEDAVFANVRADMLIAILIRRAMRRLNVRNLFTITACGLGLSAGGVAQRSSNLATEIDRHIGAD